MNEPNLSKIVGKHLQINIKLNYRMLRLG